MFENHRKCSKCASATRLSVVVSILILPLTAAAQGSQDSASVLPAATGMAAAARGIGGDTTSVEKESTSLNRVRHITLEQVQQNADQALLPAMSRLGQLSIEAARQHRLGVQADYFPKFNATFSKLHSTDFLGQVIAVQRPIRGQVNIPVPIISQSQIIAALTFTQPITPLLTVRQAVRIARADERIAMAKASMTVARKARETESEETYFQLLIARRRMELDELRMRNENRLLYAGNSTGLVLPAGQQAKLAKAEETLAKEAAEVRELTVSLNRAMGWQDDTELELAPPQPLSESFSLDEIADKAVASNPDVIVAEQTVVKARAASTISKLAYVPTVAAVSGYMFQNAFPAVLSNFGYGGVIASYNLFDFGKRERSVKEAHVQLEMAELALQMTRAKVAAGVKKSYLELERTRQLSNVAVKMGSSLAVVMKASSGSEDPEVKAARAEIDLEMLEADLAHRQAYHRLTN